MDNQILIRNKTKIEKTEQMKDQIQYLKTGKQRDKGPGKKQYRAKDE